MLKNEYDSEDVVVNNGSDEVKPALGGRKGPGVPEDSHGRDFSHVGLLDRDKWWICLTTAARAGSSAAAVRSGRPRTCSRGSISANPTGASQLAQRTYCSSFEPFSCAFRQIQASIQEASAERASKRGRGEQGQQASASGYDGAAGLSETPSDSLDSLSSL